MALIFTHIVPRFWPQIDGLGDYARLLGERMAADHQIESRYVVGDPAWTDSEAPSSNGVKFKARAVARQSADALLETLTETDVAILHYVGYGYHPRGVALWINRAMRQWRDASPKRRLIVVFHELWASGPPWKSECYLGWMQRRLVRELHKLADVSVASVPLAHRRLEAIQPGKTLLHPVPCNVATEAGRNRSWHVGGPLTVALFGMPAQRERSLRKHASLVTALDRAGLLRCVKVVGKDARGGIYPSEDVRLLREITSCTKIQVVADVTPAGAGNALAESDLLLSFYPSRWLFKSGSAMAALANGAVPVLPEGRDLDILTKGRQVLVCTGTGKSIRSLVERFRRADGIAPLGKAGQVWYTTKADWPILTEKLADVLRTLTRSTPSRFSCVSFPLLGVSADLLRGTIGG